MEKADKLSNALDKIPEQRHKVLYRKEDGAIDYKEGQTYTNRGFTSASWDKNAVMNDSPVVIHMSNTTGFKNVSAFATSPTESEVLHDRGYSFKVERIEMSNNGIRDVKNVYVKEVRDE